MSGRESVKELSEDLNFNNSKCFPEFPKKLLYKIFDMCDVKDQIVLAKICQSFKNVVEEIYKRKFNFLIYNYSTFTSTLNLSDTEIIELCQLCSGSVERLRLCSSFYSDYPNADFYHKNFCSTLKYFHNLKEIEIKGSIFLDKTVLELAIHCKKLKSISFLAFDECHFRGEHLDLLESIENLGLKACRNLDSNCLLALSKKRPLKSLNVVECRALYQLPLIIQLCNHWLYLETLSLFAFTSDKRFFKIITSLPSLKVLKLYSQNSINTFQKSFFLALQENSKKSLLLKHIKYSMENLFWTKDVIQKYIFIEHFKILDDEQCTTEDFKTLSSVFGNFKNLSTLIFQYCRPFDNEQLKHLTKINENLEKIRIEEYPQADDEVFQNEWSNFQSSKKCQLVLENSWRKAPKKKIENVYKPPKLSHLYSSTFSIRSRDEEIVPVGPCSQCSRAWTIQCQFF